MTGRPVASGLTLAALVVATGCGQRPAERSPTTAARIVQAPRDAAAPRPKPNAAPPRPRPASHQAVAVAERFLSAFFDVEIGRASPAERRRIESLATRALARRLLGEPARPPARGSMPPRARLVALRPGVATSRTAATVGAEIARGHERTALLVVLQREQGRWRVAEVRR